MTPMNGHYGNRLPRTPTFSDDYDEYVERGERELVAGDDEELEDAVLFDLQTEEDRDDEIRRQRAEAVAEAEMARANRWSTLIWDQLSIIGLVLVFFTVLGWFASCSRNGGPR
jgi:hypothetical protein